MTDTDVIEAAARALCDARNIPWEQATTAAHKFYHDLALSVLPAVLPVITPIIEAAALEKAAKTIEALPLQSVSRATYLLSLDAAAAVRALKE